MSATTFLDVCNAVENYYGTGSDQWVEFSKYGLSSSNCYNILKQVPDIDVVTNSAGNVVDYAYTGSSAINAGATAASAIDSNITTVATADSVGIDVPATITADNTGALSTVSGIGKTSAGATVTGVLGTIGTSVAAVAAGITLGEVIDKSLYSINPDYWDSIGASTLNPDTWLQITGDDKSTGAKIINTLFHFNKSDNSATMYMDENALAYYAGVYNQNKLFTNDYAGYTYTGTNLYNSASGYNMPIPKIEAPASISINAIYRPDANDYLWLKDTITSHDSKVYLISYLLSNSKLRMTLLSSGRFTVARYGSSGSSYKEPVFERNVTSSSNTSNNNNKYYYLNVTDMSGIAVPSQVSPVPYVYSGSNFVKDSGISSDIWDIWTLGNEKIYIGKSTGATVYDPSSITDNTDIASILATLKTQYPSLFSNAITKSVPQADGSSKNYTYVPVPIPSGTTTPYSNTSTQASPKVSPESDTDAQSTVVKTSSKTPSTNGSCTGSGTTPVVVTPTGSASALYTVYNPTQAQLNSFGAWLWSSSFVDQILKLFSDPMQAIIGLHKIYCSPSISGTSNIKVGYLDSGVSANVVGSQYTTVDCGSVSLLEKFGNVFDYAPFTSVGLYLPFIGVVSLNVADVMRSSLNVIYHFDVLTGAIFVEVKVIRDAGAGGTIYTYSGNGATQYPLSSGSYMGIVSGIMSIAGGIAGTISTGGAAMPLLMGAASSAMSMHTNVERSGSITGNAGAMGAKIPYLIISRPQTALADNYTNYTGLPANQEMTIGSASGFCKFLTVHLTNIMATDAEKSEIQNLFESGVLI